MGAASATAAVELEDIQGLVRFAYKRHTEAVFLLLRITDRVAARAWLARAVITNAVTREPAPSTALQVALTSGGLRALGVADDIIESFSSEFVEGMAGDPSRSRRLGDEGASDPTRWQWGWGSGERMPHVAVLLYALPEIPFSRPTTMTAGAAQLFMPFVPAAAALLLLFILVSFAYGSLYRYWPALGGLLACAVAVRVLGPRFAVARLAAAERE